MCKLTREAPTNMRDFVKLLPQSSSSVDRRIPEALSTSRERNLTVDAPGWFALAAVSA
jgi:hypothetical protein